MRTPLGSREAGSLINRPVTIRTKARFRHPRTGIAMVLTHLSATTELVVSNLISQHDPYPDSEFACHRHARLPQTFLDQFAVVEPLQFTIPASRTALNKLAYSVYNAAHVGTQNGNPE